MRFTVFYLLLFFAVSNGRAQTYSVIHVSGKIYLPAKDTYLTRGLRLDAETKLDFQSADAKAAVLSSDRGRYVIRKNQNSTGGSDMSYVLASVLTPARGRMSTRSGSINNLVDFQKKFETPKAWLSDTMKVAVSSQAYPMDDQKFFFVRYKYKGEEVNKKLSSIDDTILFIKGDFYTVDDEQVAPGEVSDMKLFYYNADEQTSTLITSIDLVNVDQSEVVGLAESLSELTGDKLVTAVHELVSSLYGECNPEQVEAIIRKG